MNVNLHITVLGNVQEEIEYITAALPGKMFYAVDGEVLILCDEGKYIISVSPNNTEFNDGNPVTSSAYLIAEPLIDLVVRNRSERAVGDVTEEDLSELEGWTSGWTC